MSVPEETAMPPKRSFRRRSPLRFWFGVGAAAVALIVTGYLGAMTLVWGLHIQTLRADHNELALLEAERAAVLEDQEGELEEHNAALLGELRLVTEGAHDMANYGDLRYVYDDYGFALKDCADERSEVLYYVQTRFTERWIVWQVHRYDDEVADYCSQLKASWAETLAEEES